MRTPRLTNHSKRTKSTKHINMINIVIFAVTVTFVVADLAFLPEAQRQGTIIKIIRHEQEQDLSGNYKYLYETANGISVQEQGTVHGDAGTAAQGSYSYTSPEGVPVQISYVADKNGFQPQGDVLPTPPPVPAEILRALEYIRAHPEADQKGLF